MAKTRFERDCLAEYGEVFKTVCVDAAYYTFPSAQYLERLANVVPSDFRFGFKVTDTITLRNFPRLDRFGDQAGKAQSGVFECRLVRELVLAAVRVDPAQGWPADVRVLEVLAERLRAGA